jgi:hypothetical protein
LYAENELPTEHLNADFHCRLLSQLITSTIIYSNPIYSNLYWRNKGFHFKRFPQCIMQQRYDGRVISQNVPLGTVHMTREKFGGV